jgi:hypothetical protein
MRVREIEGDCGPEGETDDRCEKDSRDNPRPDSTSAMRSYSDVFGRRR